MDMKYSTIPIGFVIFIAFATVAASAFNDEEVNNEEKASNFTPTFTSKPTVTYLHRNDIVILNCSVDKLDPYVLLWKKGGQVISMDKHKIFKDENIEIDPSNYSLKIKVTDKLSGEYICQISHPDILEQKHKVEIIEAPSINPHPSTGMVEVNASSTLKLVCKVKGNPPPSIKWIKDGNEISVNESDAMNSGESLVIESVSVKNQGEYQCIASNQLMKDAMAKFSVTVLDVPGDTSESRGTSGTDSFHYLNHGLMFLMFASFVSKCLQC